MHTPNFSLRNLSLYALFLCLSTIAFSQEGEINDDNPLHETKGTFQVAINANGEVPIRTETFFESLYEEIEERRNFFYPVTWVYDENLTIIIYSGDFISQDDFEPIESPYQGIKEIQ